MSKNKIKKEKQSKVKKRCQTSLIFQTRDPSH